MKISDEGDYWPRRSLLNLRRKLEEGGGPRVLHTVRGIGFSLRAAV